MTGKTHVTFALAMGTATALALGKHMELSGEEYVIGIIVTGIGGLFPDIDKPNTMLGTIIRPISTIINKIIGHRTYIHDPLMYATLTTILMIYAPETCSFNFWMFIYGIGLHLLLDACTTGGIPILYAINRKRRFRILKIKTGTAWEYITATVLFLICMTGMPIISSMARII